MCEGGGRPAGEGPQCSSTGLSVPPRLPVLWSPATPASPPCSSKLRVRGRAVRPGAPSAVGGGEDDAVRAGGRPTAAASPRPSAPPGTRPLSPPHPVAKGAPHPGAVRGGGGAVSPAAAPRPL